MENTFYTDSYNQGSEMQTGQQNTTTPSALSSLYQSPLFQKASSYTPPQPKAPTQEYLDGVERVRQKLLESPFFAALDARRAAPYYGDYLELRDQNDLDYLQENGSFVPTGSKNPYSYSGGRGYLGGLGDMYSPVFYDLKGLSSGYSWAESPQAYQARIAAMRQEQQQKDQQDAQMQQEHDRIRSLLNFGR